MFGILLELYSDRDPAFEVELFQLLMQEFGVKKLHTSRYRPKPIVWQNRVIVPSRIIWGNTLTAKDLNNLIGICG